MTFQSRFNRMIIAAYGVVCLSSLISFGFLYQENLERQVALLEARLSEEIQSLDYMLRLRYDAVNAARYQMEDYLKHIPFDIPFEIINLQAQGHGENMYFHQDEPFEKIKRMGNITGIGDPRTFSSFKWKEIKAAYALTPLFSAFKKNISSFVQGAYTSCEEFQNLYPWAPSSKSRFSRQFYEREFFQKALLVNNPKRQVFWTESYIGPDGRYVMQTCAAPIYYYDQLMGVISMDFTLVSLNNFMEKKPYGKGRVLVLDQHQGIICDNMSPTLWPSQFAKAPPYLAKDLYLKNVIAIKPFTLAHLENYWVFRANLAYAPWSVIYHLPSYDLVWVTLKDIGPGIILALLFTTAFLLFARQLILREFITPAQRLIKHIGNQGQTKDELSDIPYPWYSWFEAVSLVFDENKKLVHKLEEHIHELDRNVLERTKAISQNNKALQMAVDKLKNAQNQIIVQEKMAGLGAITAGIAHEIKNPLNFILNFAILSREFLEELREVVPLVYQAGSCQEIINQLDSNLQKIESHSKRADSIVRSMLLHARGGDDTPQLTEINSLLDENALLVISSSRQKGLSIEIKKDFEENLPTIMAYRQDLGRVFLNLINNSCYALETKQKKDSSYKPTIILKTASDENDIHIWIHDNGRGIPGHLKKQIFNPFFTTKPAGSGTGLGLSLSYDIITNQHHGKITVESEEEIFTEFHITIPRPSDLLNHLESAKSIPSTS